MADTFKLIVLENDRLLQEMVLDGTRQISVGREPSNELMINNPQVSRQHLKIFLANGSWMVQNFSTSNPARLRGQAVFAPVPLNLDEPVWLGNDISVRLILNRSGYTPPPLPVFNQPGPSPKLDDPRFVRPTELADPTPKHAYQPIIPNNPGGAANQPDEYQGTMTIDSKPGPILKVSYESFAQKIVKDYELKDARLTIGRTPDNDIMVPLPTVSRNHAYIASGPDGFSIHDNNSANGLLFQGQKIANHNLRNGDILRIGDESGLFATLIYQDQARPAIQANLAFKIDRQANVITIGRAPGNVLQLNYPQVSARHAVIQRGSAGVTIQDLGSTNGTYVHGQKVPPGRTLPIRAGDQFQIGSYQLTYQDEAIVQRGANEVRLDCLNLQKTVGKSKQVLLNNISLTIQPREFVAVVGGSGTGKSTLLDALNGFRPAPKGQVLFNGDDYYQNFASYRTSIGYVPQDDIIHRELTVERALYYVAKLRLPADTSHREIEERVSEVLRDVEMTPRRKLEVSKLSGGQRKRVSIAVELLAKPNLLFLDEPTSGLDPGLDKRMMFMLRRLADVGRTVILVTHATANINACDKVVFLAPGGKLCFFGSPHEALEFFEVQDFADIYSKLESTPTSGDEWQTRFAASKYYWQYITEPQTPIRRAFQQPTARPPKPPRISPFRQFWLLSQRYAALVGRDRTNLAVLLLQAPIIGAILAFVAGPNVFKPGASLLNAQEVLFMLSISGVWLGTSNAAREITKENPIYLRERLVNLRVAPYVLSKVVILALLCIVQSFMLVGIVVLRTGVPAKGVFLPGVIEMMITVWLTALTGVGMGLVVSALASNTDKAASLVPILLIPQIMLAGVIFDLPAPVKTVAITKWSLDALGTTADLDRIFNTGPGQSVPGINRVSPQCSTDHDVFKPGDYSLTPCEADSTGATQGRQMQLTIRWLILLAFTIVLIRLSCFFQKRKDRAWQRR